jgi:hypothetical protein
MSKQRPKLLRSPFGGGAGAGGTSFFPTQPNEPLTASSNSSPKLILSPVSGRRAPVAEEDSSPNLPKKGVLDENTLNQTIKNKQPSFHSIAKASKGFKPGLGSVGSGLANFNENDMDDEDVEEEEEIIISTPSSRRSSSALSSSRRNTTTDIVKQSSGKFETVEASYDTNKPVDPNLQLNFMTLNNSNSSPNLMLTPTPHEEHDFVVLQSYSHHDEVRKYINGADGVHVRLPSPLLRDLAKAVKGTINEKKVINFTCILVLYPRLLSYSHT